MATSQETRQGLIIGHQVVNSNLKRPATSICVPKLKSPPFVPVLLCYHEATQCLAVCLHAQSYGHHPISPLRQLSQYTVREGK